MSSIKDANFRNNLISGVNGVLHALATVTLLTSTNQKPTSLNFWAKVFDKSAFIFTRYIAPISSYGSVAFKALKSENDLVKAFIKLIPPIGMLFVGDTNVDAVMGASTSLNQPYDMVVDRIKDKAHLSQEESNFLNGKGENDFATNIKLFFNEFKSMAKDFLHGKLDWWEAGIYMVNCPMILAGSLPILLFGRNDRDSFLSRSMGLLRSAGGILGDFGFLRHRDQNKKTIGVLSTIAALSDVAKRWVKDDKLAQAFMHLASALNITAVSIWNTSNENQTN